MTDINITKQTNRMRRHARIRAKVSGTAERPRVAVFKSNRHLFVQVIDDQSGKTLVSSSMKPTKKTTKATKTQIAEQIGKTIAEKMQAKGITRAVFDASGFKYHGRVKAVADAIRAGGITI